MDIADLATPAGLIDNRRLIANIDKMQRAATAAGIRLRPHAKTHKSVAIAQAQIKAGAVGITVATVGEAEVFADHGIQNITSKVSTTAPNHPKHRVKKILNSQKS